MPCILITGANRGLGLELAKQYYAAGWQVIACSRHPAAVQAGLAQVSTTGGKLILQPLEVTAADSIATLSAAISDYSIDILCNNAGIYSDKNLPFGTVQADMWLEVFKINTIAPLMLAQALLAHVERSQRKLIVNMSSRMGSIADNDSGGGYAYRSSKAALNAITKSMALDLKGITVVAVHPGWVQTDMGGRHALLTPEHSIQGIKTLLEHLSLNDSGGFFAYDGTPLPW